MSVQLLGGFTNCRIFLKTAKRFRSSILSIVDALLDRSWTMRRFDEVDRFESGRVV